MNQNNNNNNNLELKESDTFFFGMFVRFINLLIYDDTYKHFLNNAMYANLSNVLNIVWFSFHFLNIYMISK